MLHKNSSLGKCLEILKLEVNIVREYNSVMVEGQISYHSVTMTLLSKLNGLLTIYRMKAEIP
jgi:hypothetical protein